MGTLGGNVMLDTRCLFYNQSQHWRSSLGFCLKKEGTWCHVVGSKATCVAAQSSDTVPVLIALGARLQAHDEAPRELGLDALYQQDGRLEEMHALPAHALLTAIIVPAPPAGHRSIYRKVRTRAAVDFPQLGVAIAGAFEGDRVTALSACVGAVLPKPRVLKGFDQAVGKALDDATIESLAQEAFKQVRPQRNIHGDPAWRRHMVGVEVRRALQELREPIRG
jgi:4-hydroxybenzoyl-CoA reductase subunit beta